MSEEKEPVPEKNVVKGIFDKPRQKRDDLSVLKASTPQISNVVPEEAHEKHEKHLRKLPIGLDISFSSVKAVQLAVGKDGKPVIERLTTKNFPDRMNIAPEERMRILSEVIKEIEKETHLRGETYALAPMEEVQVTNMVLPKMPEDEIASAIRWELEQQDQAGGGAENKVIDYVILNEKAVREGAEMELLIIQADKQKMLEEMQLLGSFGLKTLAIDIAPLSAFASLVHQEVLKPQEVALILDFGSNSTRLDIVAEGELRFTKELMVGSKALTGAVMDYLKIPYQEAEDLKIQYGILGENSPVPAALPASFDPSKAAAVRNAIWPVLDQLIRSIDRTFQYFSFRVSKSKYKTYDRIFLIGGAAYLKGLDQFLNQSLKVPVDSANPFAGFRVSPEFQNEMEHWNHQAARFVTAMGLALRGLEGSKR